METELQAKLGGSMSICDLEKVIFHIEAAQLPQDPNGPGSLSEGRLVLTNHLLDYGYLVQLWLLNGDIVYEYLETVCIQLH